ncbi:MAG: hypothetical protein AAB367_03800 [Patescibacteria group bacterium]
MNNKPVNDFRPFKLPSSIDRAIKELGAHSSAYWARQGEKMALSLFHWITTSTPAYRAFLKKCRVHPRNIKTLEDFKTLPPTSKDNYLRPANYIDLFPNQDIVSATTISATSGSSGEPFYFPRNGTHDDMYQYEAEIFLKEQFQIDKKSTLAVMGFGLGIWIGGIFTYKVLERISNKGYQLTIVPTGTSKEQFIAAIKKFAPFYDQIILMGYPPFIKDVLEEGEAQGIRWKKHNIKILTAAEGYSERFREYIAKKSGITNMLRDIVNIYGTVELGTMAHETAFSNLIRHIATKNKKLHSVLFPDMHITPTLCQYYPQLAYFEEVLINGKREILGTGYGTHMPLVRYRFYDLGGVIPYETMLEKLANHNIDIKAEMRQYHIGPRLVRDLPFVYVGSRSDATVIFRGANIYPEEIRYALDDSSLSKYITGRFTMLRSENKKLDPVLEIHIELQKNAKGNMRLENSIKKQVVLCLLQHNSEYGDVYKFNNKKTIPSIVFWPHQHPLYFARQGKQRWIKE